MYIASLYVETKCVQSESIDTRTNFKPNVPYFGDNLNLHRKTAVSLTSYNYAERQNCKALSYELSPFMDVIIGKKNKRSINYDEALLLVKNKNTANLQPTEVEVKIFPRILMGNIPNYLQDDTVRSAMGENWLTSLGLNDSNILESLDVLKKSVTHTECEWASFYIMHYLMNKHQSPLTILEASLKPPSGEGDDQFHTPEIMYKSLVNNTFQKKHVIAMWNNLMMMEVIANSQLGAVSVHAERIVKVVNRVTESMMHLISTASIVTNGDKKKAMQLLNYFTDFTSPCPVPMQGIFSNMAGAVLENNTDIPVGRKHSDLK